MSRMGFILRHPHIGTGIERCILMNMIVPKLEYAGEVWEGNAKLVKKLKTVQMAAARRLGARKRRVVQL